MPELGKVNREKSCFCLLSVSAGSGNGDDVVRRVSRERKRREGKEERKEGGED